MTVRPATAADLEGLHPDLAGISYRAWAGEVDGKCAAVVGLALTRPRAWLFCRFDEAARPFIRSMPAMRALKKVHDLIEARGVPVFAVREPDEEKAPALLRRLGFAFAEQVGDDEIYVWEPR